MFELIDQSASMFKLARTWFLDQPLPLQVFSGAVGFAVLWVVWILLRVILVALRATFRGL